jgi:ubiquinone biosynthesis protein
VPGLFRSVGHVARLVGIGLTLARYDALFLFEPIGPRPVLRAARVLRRRGGTDRPGQRLAAAFEAIGPAFIKLGQMLATRADLLGDEIAGDLALLQDKLPPFPVSEARVLIEGEFGCPVAGLYQTFDDVPVAAASIAQVYFATTSEGAEVAVKVLRPGIAGAFARDLDLLRWLARLIERARPGLRRLKPIEIVRTLEQSVELEMDLRFEAAAASELAENFAGDPGYHVPKVDWRRTGRGVLTTSRVGGIRFDDRAALVAAGQDIGTLLQRAAEAFFNQVFRDGFFHADLHPGNMFVEPGGAIAVVDFGIMGRLDRKTRFFLADMLVGFLTGDYRRVAEVHFAAGYVPPHRSVDDFAQAARSIGEPILGKPLAEISIARLLAQLFRITEQFEMETQPQLLLLQKTMVLVEGVGRQLDPTVNIWAMARPLIEEWMQDNRGPEAQLRQRLESLIGVIDAIPPLVEDLSRLVKTWSDEGVVLHAETLAAHAEQRWKEVFWVIVPFWLAAAGLVAIAVALFLGR